MLNLAWTPPCGNTPLQEHITFAKVGNVALDMFCDTSAEAATAAPHTDEGEEMPDPVHTKSALEIAAGQAKKSGRSRARPMGRV